MRASFGAWAPLGLGALFSVELFSPFKLSSSLRRRFIFSSSSRSRPSFSFCGPRRIPPGASRIGGTGRLIFGLAGRAGVGGTAGVGSARGTG